MSLQISQIRAPALGAIVHGVSHRVGQSQAQNQARATGTNALIDALAPRDATEMVLTGQLITVNEMIGDAAHDVLNGMVDTMKLKFQSNIVNMMRVTQGHVDRLKRMGHQAIRAEAPPQEIAEPVREQKPPPAPPPKIATAEQAALAEVAPGYERPVAPESWLDETSVDWVVETPAPEETETPPPELVLAGTEPDDFVDVPTLIEKILAGHVPDFAPRDAPLAAGVAPGD